MLYNSISFYYWFEDVRLSREIETEATVFPNSKTRLTPGPLTHSLTLTSVPWALLTSTPPSQPAGTWAPHDHLRLCKAFRHSHLLCLVRQERHLQCLKSFTATGLKVKGVFHEELMNLRFTDTAYFLNTLGDLTQSF